MKLFSMDLLTRNPFSRRQFKNASHILKTDFETVFPFWRKCLWPNRIEPIEPTSALLFKDGIDRNYQSAEVFFVKAEVGGEIIGVCSGQRTGLKEFRSRGLWVSKNYRSRGIGSKLFLEVEREAQKRGCLNLWTLARHSSKDFYLKMGMKNYGKTNDFEYGPHFWMSKKIKNLMTPSHLTLTIDPYAQWT